MSKGQPLFQTAPWTASAACRKHPTAWWYADTPEHQTRALAICRGCDVQAECFDAAIARNEDGIWGGTLAIERGRLRWRIGTNDKPVVLVEYRCAHCGTTFKRPANTQGRRVYCDRSCGKAASRQRRIYGDPTTALFARLRAQQEAAREL